MEISSINLESFQVQNITALVYTVIESLNPGECIALQLQEDPLHVLEKLNRSELPDFDFSADRISENKWKILIKKKKKTNSNSVGCGGMCGGD